MASPETSSRTKPRWTSISDSRPIAARYKPRRTCAKCSTVWASDSRSPTPRLARCPGLANPSAAALIEAAGGQFRAKYGWTDVSRFSALGIPAVNYGPGDPNLAHKRDEHVPVQQITDVAAVLRKYLSA